MDFESVLADNNKLIDEAEAALFAASDLAMRINAEARAATNPSDMTMSAQKLLDELLGVRARLLTRQAYLRARRKLDA